MVQGLGFGGMEVRYVGCSVYGLEVRDQVIRGFRVSGNQA